MRAVDFTSVAGRSADGEKRVVLRYNLEEEKVGLKGRLGWR